MTSSLTTNRREYYRAYAEKNKERIRAYRREYHERNKEKRREYSRAYYAANSERLLETSEKKREERRVYDRAYKEKNRALVNRRANFYYHQSKEKLRDLAKRRYFATRASQSYVDASAGELWSLWRRQRGCCALTGIRLARQTAHLDHRVPRSKGGADTIDNLQWVHRMANMAKGNHSDGEVLAFFAAVRVAPLAVHKVSSLART